MISAFQSIWIYASDRNEQLSNVLTYMSQSIYNKEHRRWKERRILLGNVNVDERKR